MQEYPSPQQNDDHELQGWRDVAKEVHTYPQVLQEVVHEQLERRGIEISPEHHQHHLDIARPSVPNIDAMETEDQDVIGESIEIGLEALEDIGVLLEPESPEAASALTGIDAVLTEASQMGLDETSMKRLTSMCMNQRGVLQQRQALNTVIRRDSLPVQPGELLQLTRRYQKEVIRGKEEGPLYHYHQTGLKNLENIIANGGLLSYAEQQRRGGELRSSGSRPDVVQLTRDKYDQNGTLIAAGLPESSRGLGVAGDVAFIFEPSIMDDPDYDSLDVYPNVPGAQFDKLRAVAVSDPANIPYVRERFASQHMDVTVMSRADWSRQYRQTARSAY